jgi:hypothetical protein
MRGLRQLEGAFMRSRLFGLDLLVREPLRLADRRVQPRRSTKDEQRQALERAARAARQAEQRPGRSAA